MYANHVHPPTARKFAWTYYALILAGYVAYCCVLVIRRYADRSQATTNINHYDVQYSAPKLAFCPQVVMCDIQSAITTALYSDPQRVSGEG
jgi:hypothetical protein